MSESLIFSIYVGSCCMVFYSLVRQASILWISTNGTRFTQWTFLIFNIAFLTWHVGKLLEMKGLHLWYPEEIRAILILIMSVVGFVFYSQGTKRNEK